MKRLIAMTAAVLLAACATKPPETGTLKSLERRQIAIERDAAIEANREAAMLAYRSSVASLSTVPSPRTMPQCP